MINVELWLHHAMHGTNGNDIFIHMWEYIWNRFHG